jgi:ABC-2 type transport system permease protein
VFVPVAMLIQIMLLTGAGLLLAPLAVLYGDVERLMRIVTRLLFYFSPILYGGADVRQRFGDVVAGIYYLNPLTGLFDLYRTAFFPDQWTGWTSIILTFLVSVGVLVSGAYVFKRLEGTVLKEI